MGKQTSKAPSRPALKNHSARRRGGQDPTAGTAPGNGKIGSGNGSGKFMVRRMGKQTRNPFLNYVRHLRMERDFRNMKTLLKEAGSEWKGMSDDAKKEYYDEAAVIDPSAHSPAFYKLGEHKLGPSLRKNLAQFKHLMDKAVDGNLEKLSKSDQC